MTGTRDEIVKLVRDAIRRHPGNGFGLQVEDQTVRQDGKWWYVSVLPDRKGIRVYDYAARLSEIEEDLETADGVNVLLVPVIVDD